MSVPAIDKGSPQRYAYARFDEDQPLQIIDTEDPAWIYQPFVCHVTSVPRTKAKTRRPATIRSDLDDLLAALGEPGPFETPSEYAAALVRHSSESFRATVVSLVLPARRGDCRARRASTAGADQRSHG